YRCRFPLINPQTSQPYNCSGDQAPVNCYLAPGLSCSSNGQKVQQFNSYISCHIPKKSYSYSTALLLSVFGGIFALDRFYLGSYALGFFKLISFGGLGLWYLIDLILIAYEVLLPFNSTAFDRPYFESYQLVSASLEQ
ncbi:hypothetical protein Ciccas_012949, partial [Cichlidogyrus casuarinus]